MAPASCSTVVNHIQVHSHSSTPMRKSSGQCGMPSSVGRGCPGHPNPFDGGRRLGHPRRRGGHLALAGRRARRSPRYPRGTRGRGSPDGREWRPLKDLHLRMRHAGGVQRFHLALTRRNLGRQRGSAVEVGWGCRGVVTYLLLRPRITRLSLRDAPVCAPHNGPGRRLVSPAPRRCRTKRPPSVEPAGASASPALSAANRPIPFTYRSR